MSFELFKNVYVLFPILDYSQSPTVCLAGRCTADALWLIGLRGHCHSQMAKLKFWPAPAGPLEMFGFSTRGTRCIANTIFGAHAMVWPNPGCY